HDRFSSELMDYAGREFGQQLKLTHQQLMGLGRVTPADEKEPFCMTVLALKLSRAANPVSELHGQVSRQMWHSLYPNVPVDKVPIGHITNGIDVLGWMKGTVRRVWRRKLMGKAHGQPDLGEETTFWQGKLGHDWATEINSQTFWQAIEDPNFITDEELW